MAERTTQERWEKLILHRDLIIQEANLKGAEIPLNADYPEIILGLQRITIGLPTGEVETLLDEILGEIIVGDYEVKGVAVLSEKEAIRQAIIAKEVPVPEDTPLSQYPSKIGEISVGGGGQTHTVTYIDWRGDVITEQSVSHGSDATAPAYTGDGEFAIFHSWIGNLTNITEDRRVYAQYTVLDNKARLKIYLMPEALSPTFRFYGHGAYTIDYGDGTVDSGNINNSGFSVTHTYTTPGTKIVTLTNLGLGTGNYTNGEVVISPSSYPSTSNPYCCALKEIILGTQWGLTHRSITYQFGLKYILIPYGFTNQVSSSGIGGGWTALQHVTFPITYAAYVAWNEDSSAPSLKSICVGNSAGLGGTGFRLVTSYPALKHLDIFGWGASVRVNQFRGCSALQKIEIPQSVTSIGGSAFLGCQTLRQVSLPVNITLIPDSCFSGCSSLEEIDIPAFVTQIDGSAFFGCSSLRYLNIPSTVTTLGGTIIPNCSSLEYIQFNSLTPPTITATTFNAIPTYPIIIYVPDAALDAYKTATNWVTYEARIFPTSQKPM